MDIGDVDGDEPDGDEEDTHEEHDEDGEVLGVGKGERPVPIEEIFTEENIGTGDEGECRDENTDVSRDFEREEGERHEAVEREFGELPDAVARRTMEPFIGLEGDVGPSESEPVDETAGEAIGFTESIEFVDDGTIEKSEIGRIGDDFRIGDSIEEPVEYLPSEDFYPGITPTLLSDTDDDFESFFPLPDEIGDAFGRMLEIGVEYHAGISGAEIDAGGCGDFFAEIA